MRKMRKQPLQSFSKLLLQFYLKCHHCYHANSLVKLRFSDGCRRRSVNYGVKSFLKESPYFTNSTALQIYWSLELLQYIVSFHQPMTQRRPNPTELRSMNSYNQILCRFPQSTMLTSQQYLKLQLLPKKPHCCKGVVDHLGPCRALAR